MPDALHVATLNLRNIADRWPERIPLLLADMAALQPDVIGLQEVVFAVQQDRILGAAGEGRYASRRGWAGRPEYGNAVLVREPLHADDGDRIDLNYRRSALRVPVMLPAGGRLDFVVTHLHHEVPDEAMRAEQTGRLAAWLEDITWPLVVVGDFNAEPEEPTYQQMVDAGFRSAFAEANGKEPAVTWPSGIKAPGMDLDGDPGCLDYVWVRGAITVESCRLAFDRPAVHDPTLYPSDHLGLSARLLVG
jgi:endonuclease/exonuclease/phosphatase family metal-dependent hydrolase